MADEVVVKEVWKPVVQVKDKHPGGRPKFEVSNMGRVRVSYFFDNEGNFHRVKILSQRTDENGDAHVLLDSRSYKVALLVASAFVTNPYGSGVVKHIDLNPENNTAGNLYWDEIPEYEDVKRMPIEEVGKKKRKVGRQPIPVRQYTMDGKFVQEHRSAADAARSLGKTSSSQIFNCCKRQHNYKSSYGYIWRFPSDDEFFMREE